MWACKDKNAINIFKRWSALTIVSDKLDWCPPRLEPKRVFIEMRTKNIVQTFWQNKIAKSHILMIAKKECYLSTFWWIYHADFNSKKLTFLLSIKFHKNLDMHFKIVVCIAVTH